MTIPTYSNDLNTGDEFGYDVTLNDWNESVVGAPGDNLHLGAVYLFQRDLNNSLLQTHKIVPDLAVGESNRTKFGAALSAYENKLIIGHQMPATFAVRFIIIKEMTGIIRWCRS